MKRKGKNLNRATRKIRSSNVAYPHQFKPLTERREEEGRCPECGAKTACYSCVTQGGYMSEEDQERAEREAAMERSP
jgi:hypothetical protein